MIAKSTSIEGQQKNTGVVKWDGEFIYRTLKSKKQASLTITICTQTQLNTTTQVNENGKL